MKNRNKIIAIIVFIILVVVAFILFKGRSSQDSLVNSQKSTVERTENLEKDINPHERTKSEEKLSEMNGLPQWAKVLTDIDNNPLYTREVKIEKLKELLKKNNGNLDELEQVLVSLSKYNAIEAADDIIPFLEHSDPRIQSAAIGALNNAVIPSEQELKQPIAENVQKRQHISKAVNTLLEKHELNEDVKQALVSSYAGTNPSIEDTRKMTNEIVSQSTISDNEAAYLATTLLNGKDVIKTINHLNTKDAAFKESVISSLGSNILENPATTSIPTPEQKKALTEFIQNNPPSSKNDNFGARNDQWKNSLNVLNTQS